MTTETQAMEAAEATFKDQAQQACFLAMKETLAAAAPDHQEAVNAVLSVVGVTHDQWLNTMASMMTKAIFSIEPPQSAADAAPPQDFRTAVERQFGTPSAALSFDEEGAPRTKLFLDHPRKAVIFAVHGGTTFRTAAGDHDEEGAEITLVDDSFICVGVDGLHHFYDEDTIDAVRNAFEAAAPAAPAEPQTGSMGLKLVTTPLK